MEPGIYAWCSCGYSSNQPFCDGSHRGTGLKPVIIEIQKQVRMKWCTCKQSAQEPFCDHTHRELVKKGLGIGDLIPVPNSTNEV